MRRWRAGSVAIVVFVLMALDGYAHGMIRDDVSLFGTTCKQVVTAPLHARESDLIIASGLMSAVALSSVWDNDTREQMRNNTSLWVRTSSDLGHAFQSEYVIAGTIGGSYALGMLLGKPRLRHLGVELAAAQAIAGVGTQFVKMAAGRSRPYMNEGDSHFVGFTFENGHQSFFSGDVTVAFVQASVIAAEVRNTPLAVVLYGLAACTAIQRLSTDRHWLSDTVAAAAWGTAVGWGVVHVAHAQKENRFGISVSPSGVGLRCKL